jgi:hypothetical protein
MPAKGHGKQDTNESQSSIENVVWQHFLLNFEIHLYPHLQQMCPKA